MSLFHQFTNIFSLINDDSTAKLRKTVFGRNISVQDEREEFMSVDGFM